MTLTQVRSGLRLPIPGRNLAPMVGGDRDPHPPLAPLKDVMTVHDPQQGWQPLEEVIRGLVRQELARLQQGSRTATAAGVQAAGLAPASPPLQGAVSPGAPVPGAAPAGPQGLAALAAQGLTAAGFPAAAGPASPDGMAGGRRSWAGTPGAGLTQAMAASLEKLRAVLVETEQIAQRMEELLNQESRARSGQAAGGRPGGGQGGAGGQGDQPQGTRPLRLRRG